MALAGATGPVSASLVAYPLAPETTRNDLDTVLTSFLDGVEGSGVSHVLPGVGAQTVSVFQYRAGGQDAHLVWYVEHPDTDRWEDPAAVIQRNTPLFDAELGDHVSLDEPLAISDSVPTAAKLVHASLDDRPTAFADRTTETPLVLSANDADGAVPDVVLLRLRLRPGPGTLFGRAFAGLVSATPAWLESRFESWTEPVLEAEGMYTESILIHRTDDHADLWWYMEAGGMGQVEEAYYESDNVIARLSEPVLGLILEQPDRVLRNPVASSEFHLLVHAVAPTRGRL